MYVLLDCALTVNLCIAVVKQRLVTAFQRHDKLTVRPNGLPYSRSLTSYFILLDNTSFYFYFSQSPSIIV
jgi:hypothetical protein